MVEGSMGEFEIQINCTIPEENFWLKTCVFEITHNLSLVQGRAKVKLGGVC
jgi:hypothetical protein